MSNLRILLTGAFPTRPETTALDSLSTRGACPDCDSRAFWAGPRGGLSQDVECIGCGARFWIGRTSMDGPVWTAGRVWEG
jgi:hypothetical protein